MKKAAIILLAFLVVLSFVGCNTQISDSSEPPQSSNTLPESTTDIPVSSEPTELAEIQPGEIDLSAVVPEEGYQYASMGKSPRGKFLKVGDTIYFTYYALFGNDSSVRLYTYNINTKSCSPACKNATCTHFAGQCILGDALDNFEVYDNTLYGVGGFSNAMGCVKDDVFEPMFKGIANFWHANGNLYVDTTDGALMVYENGEGKPRTLIEEYKGYFTTIVGRYLYTIWGEDVVVIDLEAEHPEPKILIEKSLYITDGHYIYYVPNDTDYLYRCKLDGSDSELLLEKPVLFASISFDDEYFYFRLYTDSDVFAGEDAYDFYRFAKDTPEKIEKIATFPYPVYCAYAVPGYEKVFVNVHNPALKDGNGNQMECFYTMNRDGSDIAPLEIPEY